MGVNNFFLPEGVLSVNVDDLPSSEAALARQLGGNAHGVGELGLPRPELPKHLRDCHRLETATKQFVQFHGAC